jgi:tetratricopeptide (TPR) repeat protein
LEYPDRKAVGYSVTGEFVDRGRWIEDGLACGDLLIIGQAAREAANPLSMDDADRLIWACDVGLRDQMWRDPQWQAQGLRVKAECYDRTGRLSDALRNYQQALAANPKVGVKRRAQQVEKLLKAGQ